MEEQLDKLAFRFFKIFDQYESTLKEGGFFQAGQNESVDVDWDRFANKIVGSTFREDLGPKGLAADFILENPPMKQIVKKNKVVWEEVPNNDKSVQALFGHIRRIRNNLLHGAKFNGTWFAPERSYTLLENGLKILEYYQSRLKRLNQ